MLDLAFLSAWKEACGSKVKGKVLVTKGTYLLSPVCQQWTRKGGSHFNTSTDLDSSAVAYSMARELLLGLKTNALKFKMQTSDHQLYCLYYSTCKDEMPSRIKVSNVRFNNIRGTSSSKDVAGSLVCSKSFPCRHVETGDIILVKSDADGPAVSSCSNVKPILTGKQIPATCV
ncbi:hypothetical protein TIFTF001_006092 [Ficus carica]|uniref:Uncharacterized protein n=1 Tax=Ficus carica TaxID=3494 RepID=A0AA87ZNH3_FICCA|nr:hypothetical protein TIFTF001_006092 [Ficus carica]